MTTVEANEVALGIESFGDDDAPLVLLAGGTTMLSWPDALCERLAAGGRRVVRYDLRDSGESPRQCWRSDRGRRVLRGHGIRGAVGASAVSRGWRRRCRIGCLRCQRAPRSHVAGVVRRHAVAPSPTRLPISDDCSVALSTTRSRWTRGRSCTGVADRCTVIRVPTRSGGIRIVKSFSNQGT